MAATIWKNDSITKSYVKENKAMLDYPENMNVSELANATTYCKTINNPYADEIVRRAGFWDKYQKTKDPEKQRKLLDKACGRFGIRLF